MIKNCCLPLVALLVCAAEIAFAKLPSSIPTCSRNDPNLNKCIVDAVNKVRPFLKSGDFGDGYKIQPIEPMSIDDIEMGRGNDFRAKMSELLIHNASSFIITDVKANLSKLKFEVAITYPWINFVGKYLLKLKILLEISGNGDMTGEFDNLNVNVRMFGSRYIKDEIEYVKFDKMTIRVTVGNMKLNLMNLFNGDKVLGEVGNTVINDNQKLFLKEVTPGIEKGLSKYFLTVANDILATTTYDEMFPNK